MATAHKIRAPKSHHTSKAVRIPKKITEKKISDLGIRLLAIRKEIIESGIPMLTEEDIARERADQRRAA